MKYYAVKKGRTPGVYRTWEDAKKQVDGFSGAKKAIFSILICVLAAFLHHKNNVSNSLIRSH